ncbi:hypothetical protein [Aquimarina macrocephali]|uniref:hypothetical protein n=1 Tax=Aquimarina macrocephali TaxID=666563 RepID=UPI0004B4F21E|nr:hypothetical protein [Aquimarina macrocephali]
MIESVLEATNLYKAERQVLRNKGASGVDGVRCWDLPDFIRKYRTKLLSSILDNSYTPDAILGVSIPKENGKPRLGYSNGSR